MPKYCYNSPVWVISPLHAAQEPGKAAPMLLHTTHVCAQPSCRHRIYPRCVLAMVLPIPPADILGPLEDFSSDTLREFDFGADFDFGQKFSFEGDGAPLIMMVSLLSVLKMEAMAIIDNALTIAGKIGQSACTASRA